MIELNKSKQPTTTACHVIWLPFFFFFFLVTRFELRLLAFARQALNILSYATRYFYFMYFMNRVLHLCLSHSGQPSSYLCFLSSWNARLASPHPVFIGWDEVSNFLPWLTSNCNTPDLSFPSNYDYRCESPYPARSDYFFRSISQLSPLRRYPLRV
jgi:hypothetical protein